MNRKMDNSSWLKRLLHKTEKRFPQKTSLFKILRHDQRLLNSLVILWLISLLFIFLYALIEFQILPNVTNELFSFISYLIS